MSASKQYRGAGRLALVAVGAGLLTFLPAVAIAGNDDSSASDGSETEDQHVDVSDEDDDRSTLREGDASSCGGSEVTVVTDEGTSHPDGGGNCPRQSTALPVAAASTPSPASTPTRSNARATPAAAATSSPAPAVPSPDIMLKVQRAESESIAAEPQRSGGFPLTLVALIFTLIAAGYLVWNGQRRRLRRAPTPRAVRVPEPTRAVREVMKQYDSLAHPIAAVASDPPTEPIALEQLVLVTPDSRTEADVLTARYLPEEPSPGDQREI